MKIEKAEVIVTSPDRNFVTLKLTTAAGITGLGDATLNGRELAVVSYLREHVAPLLIGRDAPSIKAALEPTGVPAFDLDDLPQAVRRAAGLARAGDAVLLSPACASLDMFTNYAHRAQVFVETVREIALDKGQDI